jgi:DNA-binding MarR family transcriptional regulator
MVTCCNVSAGKLPSGVEDGVMDLDAATQRLATGLVRMAVAARAAGTPYAGLERTLAQQQVLLILSRRHDVYPLASLAADLGMTTQATHAAVTTLAREGMVTIHPSPSYAPSQVRVALTERGRAQAPETLNWAADLLGELHNLDLAGEHQLLSVVTTQIRQMQRHGEIPVTKMCVTCRFFEGYAHPGTDEPHHCWLVGAPFGHPALRVRCADAELPRRSE